jgi:hypothetical protein
MRAPLLFTALFVLAVSTQAGCAGLPPLSYSAKPIHGRVVDAAAGQPLDGVIIVAQWILDMGHLGEPRLQVLETVTDATGAYQFPGWGPKANPRYPVSSLQDEDPLLSFFTPGYAPLSVANTFSSNDAVRISEWDGKAIALKRFTGPDDEWIVSVRGLQSDLSWGHRMDWHLLPRMTLVLELERLRLENTPSAKRGINVSGISGLGITMDELRRFLEVQK